MKAVTMGTIDGGATDNGDVSKPSNSPLVVGSNTASDETKMIIDSLLIANNDTEKDIHSGHPVKGSNAGTCIPADNKPHHEAPPSPAPGGDTFFTRNKDLGMIGQKSWKFPTGAGDAHAPLIPPHFMHMEDFGLNFPDVNGLFDDSEVSNRVKGGNDVCLDGFFAAQTIQRGLSQNHPGPATVPATVPATEMHKFMKFPTEIRLMIWEIAIEDAKYSGRRRPHAAVQRFRFNLAYDAQRLKPGQDKSWGWVACFTPLRINADEERVFLRASVDSRALMLRRMSVLTVHELPLNTYGDPAAPRKCMMPFDIAKDDFCLEGITHGLEEATKPRPGEDAVWDPRKLPLSDLLDNALGLRFAPRIKRLAIVPHTVDKGEAFCSTFIWSSNGRKGRDMATIVKRFPALVTVKSAIPQQRRIPGICPDEYIRYFEWKSASLRGKRQGGPSGMTKEVRDALYENAWRRIFDLQYHRWSTHFVPALFDDDGCLVRGVKDSDEI